MYAILKGGAEAQSSNTTTARQKLRRFTDIARVALVQVFDRVKNERNAVLKNLTEKGAQAVSVVHA